VNLTVATLEGYLKAAEASGDQAEIAEVKKWLVYAGRLPDVRERPITMR
jgi:hypothetical protein